MKKSSLPTAARGLILLPAALLLSNITVRGAIVGADFASDAAYNPAWANGSDGGTAATFGPWVLVIQGGGPNAGHFIGNSTGLGGPGADINTANESFGMYGHSGQASEAFRDFNGATLSVGQTFSLNLAVNFRNGNKGFDLRDASDAVIFNFNIGGDNYVVSNATTGSGSIGNAYSANTAFNLSFTQTSATGGTWTITRSGGVTDSDSGTYTGVPENFKLYNSGTDNGADANNLYSNSFTVVPEPSSAILLGFAAGSLLGLGRRRD